MPAFATRSASSTAYNTMGRPATAWRTFAVLERIRFPSPAAMTIAPICISVPGLVSRGRDFDAGTGRHARTLGGRDAGRWDGRVQTAGHDQLHRLFHAHIQRDDFFLGHEQ